jgi:hypothetical protein
MAPRLIRVLGLGCMVMTQGGSLASTLAPTPQYSRQKCMPLRHAQSRIWIGTIEIETFIFYQTGKLQSEHVTVTISTKNWFETYINLLCNWPNITEFN